jgi:hypothetical protein
MIPQRIISGGQSGADRAGLDLAIVLGIPHGGYCPKGRKSEDGDIPAKYNLIETSSTNYLVRTEKNVVRADATIVFVANANKVSGGSARTIDFCVQHGKPVLVVGMQPNAVCMVQEFLAQHQPACLNIAGSRESKVPGISDFTFNTLRAVLDHSNAGSSDVGDLSQSVQSGCDA